MTSERHAAHRISLGILLIGLGFLFATHYWFPGILFVFGAAGIARGMAMGYPWYTVKGPLVLIAIGLLFSVAFLHFLPILFIILGAAVLFGAMARSHFGGMEMPFAYEKRKNDEKFKNDHWSRDQYI